MVCQSSAVAWDAKKKWLLTVEGCGCLDYFSLDLFAGGGLSLSRSSSGSGSWPCPRSRLQPPPAARQSSQGGRPNGSSSQKEKKSLFLKALCSVSRTNFPPLLLRLSAVLESPVLAPKKMELTRENINALLGSGSFKEKSSSTFSRGSTQTSGGRGPGKTEPRLHLSHQQPSNAAKL